MSPHQISNLSFKVAWSIGFAASAVVAAPDPAPRPVTAPANAHVLEQQTRTVAVFKNGFGFFVREGEVELNRGWCMARQVPPAAFGTLAIFAHEEGNLVDIVGSGPGEVIEFDDVHRPDTDAERRQTLEDHAGVRVELRYRKDGNDRTATGRILSIGREYVVLENESHDFAVPVAGISRMQVLDLPLRIHVARDGKDAAGSSSIGMAYLREGITWVPEYTLRILDDETAELTLRGTLINEAEDLVHCNVNFVVGVPNFAHTAYAAPIAAGQVIRALSAATLPSQVMTQISNNAIIQLDNNGDIARLDASGAGIHNIIGALPEMDGHAAADYTVYTKEDLTVRKGERAIVTLFVKKIRYAHRYRWTPPERIRHFLLLHNETDTAWTTGPALVLDKDRPLSEDLLRYTPRGATGEFPVTSAINIVSERRETETDREFKHFSLSDREHLDRVILEGRLTLRNYEAKAADLVIDNPVQGRPIEASDDGEIQVDTGNLRLVERRGSIRWRLKLEPGEREVLTYRYERFVPSN